MQVDKKDLFIKSAQRINIDISEQQLSDIWDLLVNINEQKDIDYIPDNICYCFTDYALNILQKYDIDIADKLRKTAYKILLSDVIYSLCVQGIDKEIADKLAVACIKRCHNIYIRTDIEFKDIPRELWYWIFDDREEIYKKLQSMQICFIGKGKDLFTRVNIKNSCSNI